MPVGTPYPNDGKNKRRPYFDILIAYALIAILLLCVFCTAYMIIDPQPIEKFTEFYLLGPQGKADNYPASMVLGDSGSVTVGVVNHEHRDMDYDLVVMLEDGKRKVTLYDQNISLADTDTYQGVINVLPTINDPMMKLDFLLFANGDLKTPYRECYLYVDVDQPWYYSFSRYKAEIRRVDVG